MSTSTLTSYPGCDDLLLGDPAKAEKLLGWKHRVDFDSLVEEMVLEMFWRIRTEC